MLEELCDLVRNTSLCGLGQSAPNPVVSTLRYFRRRVPRPHRASSAAPPECAATIEGAGDELAVPTSTPCKIDGRDVGAREDQTILEVARENRIFIPTLCHLRRPVDSRRLPAVPGRGRRARTSCCPPASPGGRRHGGHDRLRAPRPSTGASILEMLFAERNHVCSVCVANGHCELQALAAGAAGRPRSICPYQPHSCAVDAQPRALRHRSQPLHPVHPLRPRVRRNRRRAHLGRHGPRHRCARHHRSGAALGRVGKLHRLRQVRAGLPHRGAVREGKIGRRNAARRRQFLPYLTLDAGGRPDDDSKAALATVWLDGCSGCHMSFLDMDERLIELAERVDVVCGPLVDVKEFPGRCGCHAWSKARCRSEEDLHKIQHGPRAHARCWSRSAIARSPATCRRCATRSACDRCCDARTSRTSHCDPQSPDEVVPTLLRLVRPVHEVVQGRCLRARLPALGRTHLLRAQRLARGTRPGHERRDPVRSAEG